MVAFGLALLFFFVPETFWDRTPRPKTRRPTIHRSFSSIIHNPLHHVKSSGPQSLPPDPTALKLAMEKAMTPRQHRLHEQNAHARFEDALFEDDTELRSEGRTAEIESKDFQTLVETDRLAKDAKHMTDGANDQQDVKSSNPETPPSLDQPATSRPSLRRRPKPTGLRIPPRTDQTFSTTWDGTLDGTRPNLASVVAPLSPAHLRTGQPGADHAAAQSPVPHLHNLNSPYYVELEKNDDYLGHHTTSGDQSGIPSVRDEKEEKDDTAMTTPGSVHSPIDLERARSAEGPFSSRVMRYTTNLRQRPPKSYAETLRPWNGRLSKSKWFLVALRPFILFAYPSVLWSALVYSLSVGWLIVLSESVSNIFRNRDTYNFSALGTGLVYLSPFIGGILGTAVAGKVSDIIVRFMSRRNGGVYEPEFRLVMAIPVAFSTAIGLMGYGWSAEERDRFIVPTIFFGIISFGCSLGSTTAITFCVDSYRQYAGEALVTLNFSKNIFHGLVFSLFFANWLESDGPKTTFLCIGGIQIACLLTTIPMYIYGKRGRMWTVRKGFMDRF